MLASVAPAGCVGGLLAPDVLGSVQQQAQAGQPGRVPRELHSGLQKECPSGVPSTHPSPAGEDGPGSDRRRL